MKPLWWCNMAKNSSTTLYIRIRPSTSPPCTSIAVKTCRYCVCTVSLRAPSSKGSSVLIGQPEHGGGWPNTHSLNLHFAGVSNQGFRRAYSNALHVDVDTLYWCKGRINNGANMAVQNRWVCPMRMHFCRHEPQYSKFWQYSTQTIWNYTSKMRKNNIAPLKHHSHH